MFSSGFGTSTHPGVIPKSLVRGKALDEGFAAFYTMFTIGVCICIFVLTYSVWFKYVLGFMGVSEIGDPDVAP